LNTKRDIQTRGSGGGKIWARTSKMFGGWGKRKAEKREIQFIPPRKGSWEGNPRGTRFVGKGGNARRDGTGVSHGEQGFLARREERRGKTKGYLKGRQD